MALPIECLLPTKLTSPLVSTLASSVANLSRLGFASANASGSGLTQERVCSTRRRRRCRCADTSRDVGTAVDLQQKTRLENKLVECWTKPTGLFMFSDEVCHLAWKVSDVCERPQRTRTRQINVVVLLIAVFCQSAPPSGLTGCLVLSVFSTLFSFLFLAPSLIIMSFCAS